MLSFPVLGELRHRWLARFRQVACSSPWSSAVLGLPLAEDSSVVDDRNHCSCNIVDCPAVVGLTALHYTLSVPRRHTELADKTLAADTAAALATAVDTAAVAASIADFLR